MTRDDSQRFDAVYEQLDVGLMPDVLQLRIAETILRLPEDVAAFATHQLSYFAFDPTLRGMAYPAARTPPQFVRMEDDFREAMEAWATAPPRERPWLILLNLNLDADSADPEDARGVIAHEIAHAWLGHGPGLPGAPHSASFEDPESAFKDMERATDRLATQWGFACWPSWVDTDVDARPR